MELLPIGTPPGDQVTRVTGNVFDGTVKWDDLNAAKWVPAMKLWKDYNSELP